MPRVVVIVDDNESLAVSLAIAFARIPDVETVIAHEPAAALRIFTDGRCQDKIAAIVTDFNLPHLNGFELIQQIRELEDYRTLPAIMITAAENAMAANRYTLNTPNAIFQKPFSMKEVCRVLEGLLPQKLAPGCVSPAD